MKKQVKLKNNNLRMAGNLYLPDGMDAKLTAFFGNNILKKDIPNMAAYVMIRLWQRRMQT
jgi:hypothetical protein